MTNNSLPRIDDDVFDNVSPAVAARLALARRRAVSPEAVAALRADLDDLVADGVAVAPILFDRLDWLVAVEAAGFVVDIETGLLTDPVLRVA